MPVDEVSCIAIAIVQKFWNLDHWSWMLLRVKNDIRTRTITAYSPTVSAITGGT